MAVFHTYFYIVVDTQRGCHKLKKIKKAKISIVMSVYTSVWLFAWKNSASTGYMWTHNKVGELATVCLPWQQWKELDKQSTRFTIWKY